MNTYQLIISNLTILDKSASITLTYNQQGAPLKIEYDTQNNFFNCKLSDFNYSKEIYKPGQINFKLLLSWDNTAPSITTVYNIFKTGIVQLKTGSEQNGFIIADNYPIFNIQLEQHPSASKNMYILLEAFSPDKYLTLDKYCKAYTGKKLISDIITKQTLWPDTISMFDTQEKLSALMNINPNFLKFKITQNDKSTEYEFIQPYVVQYNETFFDFLVRITNRCGEFFYFENGKFNIGWKDDNNPVKIDNFTSIRFVHGQTTAWGPNKLTDIHNDYTQKQSANTATMMRNSEMAYDEHLAAIPPKDKYTSWEECASWPEGFWISLLTESLSQTNLIDIVGTLIWKTTTNLYSAKQSADSAKDEYETTFFADKNYKTERIVKKNDEEWIHLYSSASNGTDIAFNLKFYSDIQKGIAQAENSRIHVVLENYFYDISLGSRIYFDNQNESYIVVKIEHKVKSAAPNPTSFPTTPPAGPTNIFTNNNTTDPNHQDNYGELLEIEAILYNGTGKVYPPAAKTDRIRISNPQKAIITHNNDPLKMGRVRIRYPWQNKEDDPSPWIRIAVPMASKDSGFRFLPEKGDEAIVNYEDGNIEKPYVEGMLFSADRQPNYANSGSSTRVLSSLNGHSIVFSDPSGSTKVLKSLFPIWGTLSTFFPQLKGESWDNAQKAMGGIKLTDAYGIYSISMSSDKRSISIDSPLGKVGINAFTGISISAPNGNIKIEGKNVDIVAGNNITITSGKNRNFIPKNDKVLSAVNVVAGKFTCIDMATIRTIFETFLRPIAGTLKISSKRYLCFEAGKGSAEIMGRRTVKNFSTWKMVKNFDPIKSVFSQYTINRDQNKVYTSDIPQVLRTIKTGIQTLFDEHKRQSVTLMERIEHYQHIRQLLQNVHPPLATFVTDTNIPDGKTIYRNSENNQDPQSILMQQNIVGVDRNLIRYITHKVRELNHIANTIFRNCYDENTEADKIERIFGDNFIVADTKIKNQIKKLYNPVLPSVIVNQDIDANTVDNIQINKENYRQVMSDVLNKLVENQTTENGQNYSSGISSTGIRVLSGTDRSTWIHFVDSIEAEDKGIEGVVSVAKKVVGLDKLNGILDQYVWDNTDDGKILFADEKGKTLNIQNGTLQTYMESRNDVDNIDHIIDEIKTILHELD